MRKSFEAVQSILSDILGMSKVLARWVPQMFTNDQKSTRLDISRYLLSRYGDDLCDFIERVVTQNETWVHHFDPVKNAEQTLKAQWLSPPKKFKRVHSAEKVVASIIWDSQGVIMIDYLEEGSAINSAYYTGELRRLRQEFARKRREKLTLSRMIMQDHTTAHMSQVVMTAATEHGFEIHPHPPFSPDMAPIDFIMFPN